jgi:hypothetical protein
VIGSITATSNISSDLETQPSTNYAYNAIGQLTKDESEGILSIEWNVSGKVKKVSKDTDQDLVEDQTIEFTYDAMGNRIKKISLTTNNEQRTTIYVRDARGNIMAIYEQNTDDGNVLTRKDVPLYGASQLGTDNTTAETNL